MSIIYKICSFKSKVSREHLFSLDCWQYVFKVKVVLETRAHKLLLRYLFVSEYVW